MEEALTALDQFTQIAADLGTTESPRGDRYLNSHAASAPIPVSSNSKRFQS